MFISLQQLDLRDIAFDVSVPIGTVEYDDRLKQTSPLEAKGTAELLSAALGEIRLHGKLNVTMTAACDRCLEPASVPVNHPFDLVYLPEAEARRGGEDEIDEAAIEVGYYRGAGIELNDVLREVILLAVPMQVVCSEDCKGICAVCGQNRNQTHCECHELPADDRWSQLRSLKAEIGSQN